MIVGVPGLFVAIGAFLLMEPKRIDEKVGQGPTIERQNVFLHISEHKKTLLPMFGGLIFMALIFYSFTFGHLP